MAYPGSSISQLLGMQSQQAALSAYQHALMSMGGMANSLYGDAEEIKRQQENAKKLAAVLQEKILKLSEAPAVKIAARVPDYMGTLTGWRGWRVIDGKLNALGMSGMSGVWEPKKAVRATCQKAQHECPTKDCTCGYWTFKSIALLQEALQPYAGSVRVIGTVEHWGKVIECENGFRSEFAYPKELWLLDEDLEHLSWTYGVPVRKL